MEIPDDAPDLHFPSAAPGARPAGATAAPDRVAEFTVPYSFTTTVRTRPFSGFPESADGPVNPHLPPDASASFGAMAVLRFPADRTAPAPAGPTTGRDIAPLRVSEQARSVQGAPRSHLQPRRPRHPPPRASSDRPVSGEFSPADRSLDREGVRRLMGPQVRRGPGPQGTGDDRRGATGAREPAAPTGLERPDPPAPRPDHSTDGTEPRPTPGIGDTPLTDAPERRPRVDDRGKGRGTEC